MSDAAAHEVTGLGWLVLALVAISLTAFWSAVRRTRAEKRQEQTEAEVLRDRAAAIARCEL